METEQMVPNQSKNCSNDGRGDEKKKKNKKKDSYRIRLVHLRTQKTNHVLTFSLPLLDSSFSVF